jgi:lipid-binding SYLF domain-containing protein
MVETRDVTRRTAALLIAGGAMWALGAAPARADDSKVLVERARLVVDEMRRDRALNSADLLRRARAVMVVPELSKGGLIIGGMGGGGVLLTKDAKGVWSFPAFYSLGGATFGLQAGFQNAKIVFFVMSDKALQRWLRSEFKFGAQDGVAVWVHGSEGPNNRSSQGADVIAWAYASGAYAGITLEGTSVKFDEGDNRGYYGTLYSAEEIVVRRVVTNPHANPLRAALAAKPPK